MQPLQRRRLIILNTRQLQAVKLQSRHHAPVKLINERRIVLLGHLLLKLHQPGINLLDDGLVRLRPLPENLTVALDEITADGVDLEVPVLADVPFLVLNLVAHADGVLQLAQPIARVALLLVCRRRQVVREDDDGEEHRVAGLLGAKGEVLDGRDNVGARGALDVARRDAGAEAVGEHELPPARLALLPDVGLAEDDF